MTLPKLRDLSLCVTEYQRTLDEGWNMCVREMETHLNAAKGEADEVVCEVMAVVRDSDDGPYLEFTGEGGLHDIPEGTHVWLLSGGECQPENGWMSLYTHPASSDMSPGRPPQAWVEAAYARFLEINGGDKDRAQTDLGTWVIGINAAMAAREGGE